MVAKQLVTLGREDGSDRLDNTYRVLVSIALVPGLSSTLYPLGVIPCEGFPLPDLGCNPNFSSKAHASIFIHPKAKRNRVVIDLPSLYSPVDLSSLPNGKLDLSPAKFRSCLRVALTPALPKRSRCLA